MILYAMVATLFAVGHMIIVLSEVDYMHREAAYNEYTSKQDANTYAKLIIKRSKAKYWCSQVIPT